MRPTIQAYLGLGANSGPARRSLERAVAALADLPGAELTGISRLYRTRPVGPVAQADFLNAVVGLRLTARKGPTREALDLLGELKHLERALGRQGGVRWGPRAVDIDLLLFGEHAIRTGRTAAARSEDEARAGRQWLEVPHPEAAHRLFVLAPLAELAPALRPPGWGLSVAEARDRAASVEGEGAVRAVATWDTEVGGWTSEA